MAYDIGKITRELQAEFRLFDNWASVARTDVIDLGLEEAHGGSTNLATPENVGKLLTALEQLTSAVQAKRAEMSSLVPDASIVLFDGRMKMWRARLQEYRAHVAKAPPGDREDILWSVTAPVLIGYYGGPNSEKPQQIPDALTPFMLANQLDVADAWRDERWKLFKDQLGSDLKKAAGTGLATALVIGGIVVAGGFWWLGRR